jgi:spectrin beta
MSLEGAKAAVASDYNKRPHVFRLKLSNGGDYLFHCKDDVSFDKLLFQKSYVLFVA